MKAGKVLLLLLVALAVWVAVTALTRDSWGRWGE